MVKKVEPKTLGEAYKGTLSTFIVTLIILGIGFFLPMISAKEIQDAREGKGRYTPKENIFWDLEGNSDMETILIDHISDTSYKAGKFEWGLTTLTYGSPFDQENTPTSMYWVYKSRNVHTNKHRNSYYTLTTEFLDDEFPNSDKVNGKYLHTNLLDLTTWNGYNNEHYFGANLGYFRREEVRLFLDLDVGQWIKNDANKIHLYFEFDGTVNYLDADIVALSRNTGRIYRIYNELIDVTTEKQVELNIEIEIDDLIGLINNDAQGRLVLDIAFRVRRSGGQADITTHFYTNSNVIFDLQVYGIMGTPNAITLLSIWFVIQAIGIFLLGIVMLPQISIGDIAHRLNLATKS